MRQIRFAALSFGLMALAGAAQAAPPEVPKAINFQGRLTDSAGAPVNGTQSILFKIWDAPTGGNQLWSETQNVTCSTGIYNVALGTVTALSTAVFSGGVTYLEIKVGADAAMTPRLRFQTAPYSFDAQFARSLLSALPMNSLFDIVPVNTSVNNSGYSVPANKNFIGYRVEQTSTGAGRCHTQNSGATCRLGVTGTHTGTTVIGAYSKKNPIILGPGDVVASTAAAITFELRGVLVPNDVTVVLQDVANSGTYSPPGGKSLYFGAFDAAYTGCTGTIDIGGFTSTGGNGSNGGMLPDGQTLTNNMGCTITLNGYLR